MLTTGTLHLNVPHNLLHSGKTTTYITIGYDIIHDVIEVYVSRMDFDTWCDVKDIQRLKTHCERMVRITVAPDPFEPSANDCQAFEAWVAAGEPY